MTDDPKTSGNLTPPTERQSEGGHDLIRASDRRKKAEAGWESEGCWPISESCPGCCIQPYTARVKGTCNSSKAVFWLPNSFDLHGGGNIPLATA